MYDYMANQEFIDKNIAKLCQPDQTPLGIDAITETLLNTRNPYDVLVTANRIYANLQKDMANINNPAKKYYPDGHVRKKWTRLKMSDIHLINENMSKLSILMRKLNDKPTPVVKPRTLKAPLLR